MRLGASLVVTGCFVVLSSIALNVNDRHLLENDLVDIGRMRTILDSSRALQARATTAAESSTVRIQIEGREAGIARREFHVPLRQERVDGWWRAAGPGTLSVVFGAMLAIAGIGALRREKKAA